FNEKRLRFLNRGHTNQQVSNCLQLLEQYEIKNINLDLMYALPGQTQDELITDITTMMKLNPTHISTYALIFEPHTVFHLKLQENKIAEVSDEVQEVMYQKIQETLEAHGYWQYEFSNWAKPGALSRHNTKYWDLSDYVGIGLGSHG